MSCFFFGSLDNLSVLRVLGVLSLSGTYVESYEGACDSRLDSGFGRRARHWDIPRVCSLLLGIWGRGDSTETGMPSSSCARQVSASSLLLVNGENGV